MATSRARLFKALWAFFLIATLSLGGLTATLAQDDSSSRIEPSTLGEVPTTGGQRPGPAGALPSTPESVGVIPIAIQIPNALVDATVETRHVVDGVMEDPTGPWVISWYEGFAALGQRGNILMAGHLDYWDVGPAVLYNINNLNQGDQIMVTGEDGEIYTYEVDWRENFSADGDPEMMQQITGPTDNESLTLITCGGPFDYTNGVYLERTVVRAHRVETEATA